MAAPLNFGYGKVISVHTLWLMALPFHGEIKVNPCVHRDLMWIGHVLSMIIPPDSKDWLIKQPVTLGPLFGILGVMGLAIERWCYTVTFSLIGPYPTTDVPHFECYFLPPLPWLLGNTVNKHQKNYNQYIKGSHLFSTHSTGTILTTGSANERRC